ncbi:acyl-CoA/acyl-ACP dehydrogenase [Nocardia sp. NBC_00565]|uniref:acyl-CoA dehydrogenase family protein n=1 Tax=Nocardia sp. NBC_00565 TaxID=2975993 RepID=UPI002E81C94A|nr:acyl-CoA dehydrogenase family protein [Nocardia sp. NBC_00565]WUC02586.1 acyl-CoA/acyl-ACP dehydrogenase [Nocardia sp. NBC_00565]
MNSWIERAQYLADEVFAPAADAVDREGRIPGAHFDLLAEYGFYGATMSAASRSDSMRGGGRETGRADVDISTFTQVGEILVAGCLTTTFVWAQHLGVARRVANSPNLELRERLTEDLRHGRVRAGVTYAGANDQPGLTAHRVEGGYVLDGTAPFVTGWGLVDIIGVMARAADDENALISVLVPAESGPAVHAEPLPLIAADASNTVTLTVDGLMVPDSAVENRISLRNFHATFILAAWRNGALALGLVRRCLGELADLGVDTTALAAESARIRTELDDALSGQSDIYVARARASELAVRAAAALVTAIGSAAVTRGNRAERSLREATFTLVFGSRPAIRTALLDRLTRTP